MAAQKIKSWWSEDRKWFCVLVDDGICQATMSLTPEEADAFIKSVAPPSRTFDDGLRKAAEIARNFGDLYCHDSPCPTCEHIAQAILAGLTSTTQPTRSFASPELVEQIKHLAELVGLKFIPFGDKP